MRLRELHYGVPLTFLMAGAAWAQPSFHELGFLNPVLQGPSIAYAVSADGSAVVGQSNSAQGFQAFRWTAGTGMVGLGAFANPGGFPSSVAFAVSADGSVVAGASVRPDSLNEDGSPFRWTAAEGLVYLGSLGGTEGGAAHGMTPDGGLVVGMSSSADFSCRAFTWAGGAMAALPDAANQAQAEAFAVSADGSAIVGAVDIGSPGNGRPVVWRNSGGQYTPMLLPVLNPNTIGTALAVTPDGSVIVGQSAGHAARWTGGNAQDLGLLPNGIPSGLYFGTAVSADGGTVVGLGDFNAGQGTGTAFIWDAAHGMRDLNLVLTGELGLNLHGFTCYWARGISADGKIVVGYGFNADGQQEAFLADLHTAAVCYPNCDSSTAQPVLNVNDFICFQTRFAAGDSYANCDGSTAPPVLNVNDFVCFQTRFAGGCQ